VCDSNCDTSAIVSCLVLFFTQLQGSMHLVSIAIKRSCHACPHCASPSVAVAAFAPAASLRSSDAGSVSPTNSSSSSSHNSGSGGAMVVHTAAAAAAATAAAAVAAARVPAYRPSHLGRVLCAEDRARLHAFLLKFTSTGIVNSADLQLAAMHVMTHGRSGLFEVGWAPASASAVGDGALVPLGLQQQQPRSAAAIAMAANINMLFMGTPAFTAP
jgi:hypothetical protein